MLMNLDSKTIGELHEAYEKCGQTVRIENGHVYSFENEKRTYEVEASINPISKNMQEIILPIKEGIQ
ncbi:hypothetical protein [Lachnotalea glycerini]|uniref:Uncharacterized protein n=1 Tax=Lachnotalea glycerini TaxID=1763509 RepID=A0A371JBR1_9FIRM|nr:hypothetical protein [Lachnotalea glycerini]RDY30163.1 hypothetical protein CG710_016115 [Lachnotalea glycerini]